MNLLYTNDKQGQYPPSWYADTATSLEPFEPLRGEIKAQICVIGAGFTGLSAALHLAEAGHDVALIEAHRVGFGASGRNGGQLGSGQRIDQESLEKLVGRDDAAKLWDQGEEAKDLVKSLVGKHKVDCHLKPGIAHACFSAKEMHEGHAYAAHLQDRYGYDQIETMDAEAFRALVPSPTYHGGELDMGAAHLHPLSYALGLARAARDAGVRIYERSEVHHIKRGAQPIVQTDKGRVLCDHVILACNGYLGGLDRKVAARVMPINNFIIATEPLGEDAARILTRDVAVADTEPPPTKVRGFSGS